MKRADSTPPGLPTRLTVGGLGAVEARWLAAGGAGWIARGAAPDGRVVGLKVAREAGEPGRARLAHEAFVRAVVGGALAPVGGGRVALAAGWHALLAFPWIEGEPLDASLRDAEDAERALAALARDVGAALARLHALGLRHGDVKPANVLRADGGEPRFALIDLGLAAPVGTALAGGTPAFLPPELAQSRDRLGPEADVFALGATARGWASRVGARLSDDHWAIRATSTRPGDRPSAAGLAGCSARPEVAGAYVMARRRAIEEAARSGASAPTGPAVAWLSPLLATLSGMRADAEVSPDALTPASPGSAMPEMDTHERTTLITSVLGADALRWTLPASLSDEPSLLAALERLASLAAPTSADLVRAARAERDGAGALSSRLAAVAARPADEGALDALARCAAEGQRADEASEAAAIAVLRRAGRAEEVLSLVRTRLAEAPLDPTRLLECAEVLRAAGLREEAARVASTQGAPVTDACLAVRARLALDAGDVEACEAALARASDPRAPEIAEVSALVAAMTGHPERGLAALTGVVEPDGERGARMELVRGMLAHGLGDAQAALRAFERSAEQARALGAAPLEASARASLVAAAHDAGRMGLAAEAADRAVALLDRLGRAHDAARARLNRGAVMLALGAHAEAAADAEAAQRSGDPRTVRYARWLAIDVALDREGALPDAELIAPGADPAREDDDDAIDDEQVLAAAYDWLRGRAPSRARRARVEASLAGRAPTVRWCWWRAALRGGDAAAALDGVLRDDDLAAPPALVGPTLALAIEAARQSGRADAARLLSERLVRRVARLEEDVPPAYRARFAETSWARAARGDASARADELGLGAAQIDLLARIARAMHERASLGDLLRQVVDGLVLWVGAERGLLLLRAPGQEPGVPRLVPRVARGLAREDLRGDQLTLSRTLAARALSTREPVVALDAAGEHDADDTVGASIHALHLRSVLAVPLFARGEALGVVYLDDRVRRGAFGPREVGWVRLLATHAAAAIADARDTLRLRRLARQAERARRRLEEHLVSTEGALEIARAELATRGATVAGGDPRGFRHPYEAILGESAAVRRMLSIVDRIVDAPDARVPILIGGESGTGKELVAHAIHEHGPRARKPFVAENCGAIPEALLESTLFGHVRGAFTGADRARAGLFEVAAGGTLFLDEVAELGLSMQAKLLRVLQDGEVRPIGAERGKMIDVRVIAATHRDLSAMVRAGTFREDLYYRLAVVTVSVPPLRERAEDVPLLVEHFLRRFAGGRRVRVSRRALAALATAPWPGNVRQLENEIRRALVLGDDALDVEHLSAEVAHPGLATREGGGAPSLREQLDALEYRLVREALRKHGGNQTRAAVDLGVSRFGLQKMLKRLGLAAERPS
jgi:transcriptional regulator with GAF, ATPase, and Fis domain/tetratricopeptide (TPR) repeat protein